MKPIACENCIFALHFGDQRYYCRRYPPIPVVWGGSVRTKWPMVDAIDRCGEFSPKPEL